MSSIFAALAAEAVVVFAVAGVATTAVRNKLRKGAVVNTDAVAE
jgi:hypothetical protein